MFYWIGVIAVIMVSWCVVLRVFGWPYFFYVAYNGRGKRRVKCNQCPGFLIGSPLRRNEQVYDLLWRNKQAYELVWRGVDGLLDPKEVCDLCYVTLLEDALKSRPYWSGRKVQEALDQVYKEHRTELTEPESFEFGDGYALASRTALRVLERESNEVEEDEEDEEDESVATALSGKLFK